MSGHFRPPDHSKGDPNTIGGYARVHDRPAAFEGSDGLSYSVAIETAATGDAERPFGACFVFLRWRRIGRQGIDGHLETPFLAWGQTTEQARAALGAWSLADAKWQLDALIQGAEREAPSRRWWDAMRDESR
jgi:hypothetical protein